VNAIPSKETETPSETVEVLKVNMSFEEKVRSYCNKHESVRPSLRASVSPRVRRNGSDSVRPDVDSKTTHQ
jgi:hypothetical protein